MIWRKLSRSDNGSGMMRTRQTIYILDIPDNLDDLLWQQF